MEASSVKFRCGADPEVFLVNQQGKHIAINGLINADKWNPMQIPDMPEGFTLQEDNVALEYGIPPAATSEEFISHIQSVMDVSRKWLPEGVTFSKLSCVVFEDDQLVHPMARVFGCEPDYCAYTKKANPRPRPDHPGMRSAGGHVHVETQEHPLQVIKAMDLFLAVPSVIMDDGKERKKLYGKAGAFRPKPYGVEYRTLSNFWMFDKKLIDWVWRNTERALSNLKAGTMSDHVEECINNNDEKIARALINEFNLEVV